ncbi:MAG: hypothetical protein ACETWG_13570 [Candidatus Neomarinimicrobiota bacterium]
MFWSRAAPIAGQVFGTWEKMGADKEVDRQILSGIVRWGITPSIQQVSAG